MTNFETWFKSLSPSRQAGKTAAQIAEEALDEWEDKGNYLTQDEANEAERFICRYLGN